MAGKEFLPVALDIIMDTYGARRIKEMTQTSRDTTTRKIVIGGTGLAMPKSRNCPTFLSNVSTKQS